MKYAPADEYGRKPYVVTKHSWGRDLSKVVFCENASEARWVAWGRLGVGEYHVGTRRATPADLEVAP